ncbi:MAG: fluoride efflux transporter CrcB [Peptococcaceae bacterium]|nr:fluoride efflux transporter CrcB [Peptococcaceae bacterium]
MNNFVLVGIGGFFGAIARYLIGLFFAGINFGRFPLGTFVINITGSFLLGLIALNPFFMDKLSEKSIIFMGVGFLGAYTTFSTLEFETLILLEKRQFYLAVFYVSASFSTGILLAWLASC